MSKTRLKVGVSVVVLLVVIVVLASVLGWYYSREPSSILDANRLEIDVKSLKLSVKNGKDDVVLNAMLGLKAGVGYTLCEESGAAICIEWSSGEKMVVVQEEAQSVDCYDVRWTATKCGVDVIENCFSMVGSHWYGGAQVKYQLWPIEKWSRGSSAFVAGDSYVDQYGGVLERYFLSSKGVALIADKDVPLFVSVNDTGNNNLCFGANWKKPYIQLSSEYPMSSLAYKVCVHDNIRKVHDYVGKSILKHPIDIPDERMFRDPIWSTWAQYKKSINQSTVLEFANAILNNSFTHSQIEIDDDWTPKYGDLVFNPAKFPNATQMITQLKGKGFRVTVWVHPFFNIDSLSFYEAGNAGFLMKDAGGVLPALTSWWDGNVAGILDVTNVDAVKWFKKKLTSLQETYGVDSFKFDAGETNWLPAHFLPNKSFSNPEEYTRLFAQLAYEADSITRHQEVRVAAPGSQDLPIFVRMMDKDSSWGYDNGLKTVIPDALTFGILGFPFVLPDMIGGNAYNGSLTGLVFPDRELYIRWLQVNVFLPSMQFSITPWLYDDEVIGIARDVINLRAQYTTKIISLAREATRTGAPIVRPLWWIAPTDEAALKCDNEFLLGNDILVAPVLDKGAKMRDIYLPAGTWLDKLRNKTLDGGKWHRSYSVELHELPFFILQS